MLSREARCFSDLPTSTFRRGLRRDEMDLKRKDVLLRLLAKGASSSEAFEGAGGLNMPVDTFAHLILEKLYDQMPEIMTKRDVADLLRNSHDTPRLVRIYTKHHKLPGDPWDLFVTDLLSEMIHHEVLMVEGDHVALGPSFREGANLLIAGDRKKKHCHWTHVLPKEMRQLHGKIDSLSTEIASAVWELKEEGPGIKKLDPKVERIDQEKVERLANSMREHGYSGPPITIDQRGRVLIGRHMFLAAKKAGVEPVIHKVKVRDDTEAVLVAIRGNDNEGWSRKDREWLIKRFQAENWDDLFSVLGPKGIRERIEAKLNLYEFRSIAGERSMASSRAIAAELRCSHHTVERVRAERDHGKNKGPGHSELGGAQVPQFGHILRRVGKDGLLYRFVRGQKDDDVSGSPEKPKRKSKPPADPLWQELKTWLKEHKNPTEQDWDELIVKLTEEIDSRKEKEKGSRVLSLVVSS
jgi:hypothetical protein